MCASQGPQDQEISRAAEGATSGKQPHPREALLQREDEDVCPGVWGEQHAQGQSEDFPRTERH